MQGIRLTGIANTICREFNSQGIAITVWAYSKMSKVTPTTLRSALLLRATEILPTFTPLDAQILIWALSYSQIDAPIGMMERATNFAAEDPLSCRMLVEVIR